MGRASEEGAEQTEYRQEPSEQLPHSPTLQMVVSELGPATVSLGGALTSDRAQAALAEPWSSGKGLLGLGDRRGKSRFALLSWTFSIVHKIFFDKCGTAKSNKLESRCPWWSLRHPAPLGHQETKWTTQTMA